MSNEHSNDQRSGPTSIAECPYCQKGGLPILPLRYAVARTDIAPGAPAAPRLAESFGEGVEDIPLPEGQHYTLRLLRPGYLYVFNEVRGSWSGYVVTEKGYLYPYVTELLHRVLVGMDLEKTNELIDSYLQPPAEVEEFSCASNAQHYYPGRCITIPNADRANNIYLAFSDTAWTKRVWYEHATNAAVDDSGVRRRDHMRRISLNEWRGGAAIHAAHIDKVSERVVESAYPDNTHFSDAVWQVREEDIGPDNATSFGHDGNTVNGLGGRIEGLVSWAKAQSEPYDMEPLMVGVEDPVGITADIASLMRRRLREFANRPELKRPLTISALLGSLESAIRSQGELAAIKKVEERAIAPITPGYAMRASDGGLDLRAHHERRLKEDASYRQRWERETAALKEAAVANMTATDLETSADEAWEKYQETLEPGQPERWRKEVYLKALEEVDRAHTIPLARAHTGWLCSDAMVRSFACNHDDANAESGAAYIQALLLCIQDTQEIKLCFELYQEWLDVAQPDERNLLQKALTHNQKSLIDAFNGTDASTPDVPYDKWANLIDLYGHAVNHLNSGEKNIVAQLIVAVGGPIMNVLDKALDRGMHRLVLVLGVVSGSPIVKVQHLGTVDETMDVMVRMMKQLNPEALADIDADLLKRRLQIESRGQHRRVETVPNAEGRPTQRVTMRIDRFALIDMEMTESSRSIARQASNTLLTMDEWPEGFSQRLAARSRQLREIVDGNAKLAVVSLILQGFAIGQMTGKLDEQMWHQGTESSWRYRATGAAMVSGVVGVVNDFISNGAKAGNIRLAITANKIWFKRVVSFSRYLGLVGALTVAFFDIRNAYSEFKEGDLGLAAIYGFSAIAGFGSFLIFSGFITVIPGLGLGLLIVAIALSLLIDKFKDNALQEWMERSIFGILNNDRYPSIDIELGQLELALKSMTENKAS